MPISQNTGNWSKTLDRLLTEVFNQNLKLTEQKYTQFFSIQKSSKASEKHLTTVGLEDWRESGEGVVANYTSALQGFTKQYVPTIFKSGIAITREIMEDDLYDVVASQTKQMSQTAIRTIDKDAAKLFNNATNTTYFTGADNLALASASHTREDGGTVLSNANTGVLNETNYETAKVKFMERLDGRGEIIDMNPNQLLVPPALEKEARILLKSLGRPATGNNDINPYKDDVELVVWKRLGAAAGGSDTAWAILDSTFNKSGRGLNIFMRVNPEIGMETELETGVKKWVGYMRYSLGFTDWRGVEHSTGAA